MGYNFMAVDNSVDNSKINQKTNVLSEWIIDKADAYNKIKTEGQQWKDDRFDKRRGYSFWISVNAVRMFPKGTELPKDITPYFCGLFYRCANMLQANTNMLVKRYCNYERPITKTMLADELGIGKRQCQRLLKLARERHIIKEYNCKLYMNPIFFMCGRYLTHQLYTLFQEDLDAFLPQWVIDRFNGDVNA
jgi:hypothetical protein